MTDKERLEEASEWLRSMYDLLSLKTDVEDIEYTQKRIDLFNWLIEQVNRLYGGETFKGYKEMYEYSERIKNNTLEENQRYKQALDFYADEENYEPESFADDYLSQVDYDCGEKARKALEESE